MSSSSANVSSVVKLHIRGSGPGVMRPSIFRPNLRVWGPKKAERAEKKLLETRDPFLKSPGNFSGPKSDIQIEI